MEIIKFLQSFSTDFLDKAFQFITILGEGVLYVLVIAALYWCVNKSIGLRLAFIQIFSMFTNGVIKNIFKASRPIGQDGIFSLRTETATGYSFPSGHSQGSTTFWAALMRLFKKVWIYILGSIIVLAVGISRLYLGVHWPKDVVGGIIFGVLSVFIADKIIGSALKNQDHRYLLILVLPAFLGLIFFQDEDYIKTVALAAGFYVGYLVESKLIAFHTKSSFSQQVIKILIGLLGALILKISFKLLLPDNNIVAFIDYSLLALWIMAGAPFAFVKLGLSSSSIKSINVLSKSL
ncbi:MAG: phosphatase PAP2 family protein [Clostridiales bacterium]|nr:phosphatase PAP2 family protein [Clostridiales bacterium]